MPHVLHDLLEAAADATPNATALVDADRRASYAELDRRANQVARHLIGHGVRRGDRVGLYLDKSLEAVVGLYGILKAGAAYVPLDPSAPPRRLGYIARDAGIAVLLTSHHKSAVWSDLVAAGAPLSMLLCLDGDAPSTAAPDGVALCGSADLAALDAGRVGRAVTELELAYVLYTSGSTGKPKGVMLTHRNALAFVEWVVDELRPSADDRFASHAPLQFDLSVLDLFASARVGAALHLVPRSAMLFPVELAGFIRDRGITVWYSVPSALVLLATRGGLAREGLPSLRTVLFAGEVFPTPMLRRLTGLLPHARFTNLYGPTETNVCTFHHVTDLDGSDDRPVPIGLPIRGVDTFVVTDDGRIAEPGETGELWVRGPTVMRGYLGDDERTGAVFGVDPRSGDGALAYRTGDLVSFHEPAGYRFLGRRDLQVKIRGYRIELGEVESALHHHPTVTDCAAVAVPDPLLGHRIVAHVVAGPDVTVADLLAGCRDRLPDYMVPSRIELHAALPRTTTGKIDRQVLAKGEATTR
ncbi:amino acid adenylation domain-containing protein [Micromonospora sp. NPDC047074]|uniref:amino acid adenylation domain-containing protein n=1 Tax=Micromonospora sp. NPDC047074 TaxID=3154339 RepID=UPI0033D6D21C